MEKTVLPLPTLRALARKMRTSQLSNIALSGAQWSVRMTFVAQPSPLPAPADPAPSPLPAMHSITAPMPGTLLHRHPHSTTDFVAPQQHVQAGEVVALVQLGPLYVPAIAPHSGTVAAIVASSHALVEYAEEILVLHGEK